MSISHQWRCSSQAVFLTIVVSLSTACDRGAKQGGGPSANASGRAEYLNRDSGPVFPQERHASSPSEQSDHASITDPLLHANHGTHPGGQMLMHRNHHVEVVLEGDGKHRAYVTDLERKPTTSPEMQGHLTILRAGAPAEHIPFIPEGDHLVARGRALKGSANAKIELNVGERTPLVAEPRFPVLGDGEKPTE